MRRKTRLEGFSCQQCEKQWHVHTIVWVSYFFLFSISMGLIIYSFHKIIYLPCLNRDQERPRSCLYEALRGIKVISGARVASEVEGPCP